MVHSFCLSNTSLKQLILVMNYSYMLSDGPVLILLHHPEYYTNISTDWTAAPIMCLNLIYHCAHTCTQILLEQCSAKMVPSDAPWWGFLAGVQCQVSAEFGNRLAKETISQHLKFLRLWSSLTFGSYNLSAFQNQCLWTLEPLMIIFWNVLIPSSYFWNLGGLALPLFLLKTLQC